MDKDISFYQSVDPSLQIGELMTVFEKDITESAELLTDRLANGLRSLNSSVNGSIVLYSTSPRLCALSLCMVPLIGVGAMSLSRRSKRFI